MVLGKYQIFGWKLVNFSKHDDLHETRARKWPSAKTIIWE